jgi:hypothetical protein
MTELIWEGKYKDDKKVTPIRIAYPFRPSKCNESAQQRQKTLDFSLQTQFSVQQKWRNRLIGVTKNTFYPAFCQSLQEKLT